MGDHRSPDHRTRHAAGATQPDAGGGGNAMTTVPKRNPGFKRQTNVLFTFLPYAWPFKWQIGFALFLLLLDALSDLAAPWPVKLIFDNVLLGKPLHSPWSLLIPASVSQNRMLLLAILAAALVWLALFSAVATYAGMKELAIVGQNIIYRLRSALFAHLQQLSPSFYDRQR